MGRINDWNNRLSFQSEMTNTSIISNNVVIEVTLTWLEIFVGFASIVRNTESINEIKMMFNHMLFGYSETFSVPDSVYREIITSLVDLEVMEWIDSNNVRLSQYGRDFLIQNWLIDRSVYLNTRIKSNKLVIALKNEDRGTV